jgi:hypothetical protein
MSQWWSDAKVRWWRAAGIRPKRFPDYPIDSLGDLLPM